MSDLINRKSALKALRPIMRKSDYFYEIQKAIQDIPSAQPERKPGHWEIYIISMFDGEGCRCSECGFEGAPYWDFCPNCGADMRGNEK